jgi:chromosome segregation ATPase
MGFNDIFKDGIKEFKRRTALFKKKRLIKKKEKQYSPQLTALGKKAWESHLDLDAYGDLKESMSGIQKNQEELSVQLQKLEQQKQDIEEKRKQKDESYDSQLEQAKQKKDEVDSRLSDENKVLNDAKEESHNADKRLKEIDKEGDDLKRKAADPQTPEEEKTEINQQLKDFSLEKEDFNQKFKEAENLIISITGRIKPIESESGKLKQEIDDIRDSQKEEIGELDQTLSEIKEKIDEEKKKLTEISKEQVENFEELGIKLAAAGVSNDAICAELSNVRTTEKDMAAVKVEIEKLDQEGTPGSRKAFWQLIGIIALFIIVILAIVIVLF